MAALAPTMAEQNLAEQAQARFFEALHRYWGYESFRPGQENIVRSIAAGRDACVVMPTGEGKSLCYQLPAVLDAQRTVVVVSPLIALMQDQVAQLEQMDIPAGFLNSSLSSDERSGILRRASQGHYRLLYLSPERIALDGTPGWLGRVPVSLFAIDETHCISEWGHDFRPEYRQLAALRDRFPDVPVMALTATATERVRRDVVVQLRLRSAGCYVASFNRPNLTYRVSAKAGAYGQILSFVRARPRESGIIYCQARKTAEALAGKLNADGVRAATYHAGMETAGRTQSQEAFLRDEVRVVCATIAFGMGINKPNVRFVVHYDLPKNIESYYQETGRAGRDGLPSECVLLFSAADVVKQTRFIEEKSESEARIAREQLRQMVHYAEARECRRATLLKYFGEEFPASCNGCDNCLEPRETFDGTVHAQKFLSCIYRIYEKHGFGFGLNHVVDVLAGAETEGIRQRGHDELSTYGIGRDVKRTAWLAIGRELLRLGLIAAAPGKFATLQLTEAGRAALRERKPITLTKPFDVETTRQSKKHRAGDLECDEALFAQLRVLRRQIADERDVPAYVIFSDVSLREMARVYPTTAAEFGRIPGVGQQKLRDFAEPFTSAISSYLTSNPRQPRVSNLRG